MKSILEVNHFLSVALPLSIAQMVSADFRFQIADCGIPSGLFEGVGRFCASITEMDSSLTE